MNFHENQAGLSYSRIELTKDSRTKCLGRIHESRDEVLASHCNPPRAVYSYPQVLRFPKPGKNHKLPGNYRPINLLSSIGTVFEKAIVARLKEECQELDIIPNEQYGFRANHGCIHQLLRVTNTITQGYNHKLYTGGVFLVVRKAFDRMWHNVKEIAAKLDIKEEISRVCRLQTARNNVPYSTEEEYYRRAVYVPYLDDFCNSLKGRFESHKETVASLQHNLPEFCTKTDLCSLEAAFNFYEEDLSHKEVVQSEFMFGKKSGVRKNLKIFPKQPLVL
ncbi:putative RNA-directed DNA polymerase from transposon X-element [Araneus ventricosus]|uniref:Putative RNA-directed DNA polymerase from transposon X-element n=1 Tax=Araneus ventricosus TaxID=182803 RepID=A0A4Y2R9G7_ARAVE|nr:putative RNA-directed DNA polymerase from transposon X-element [Araneus ventricosus]